MSSFVICKVSAIKILHHNVVIFFSAYEKFNKAVHSFNQQRIFEMKQNEKKRCKNVSSRI